MNKKQLLENLKQREFSEKILRAFEKTKREDFVSEDMKKYAYEDSALPIGYKVTISQPYTIAVMLSLLDLKKGQKILEIGSGCGYVLALLSELTGKRGKVFGIEILKPLVLKSKENLEKYRNVEVFHRNGSLGLPEKSKFDRILISAGSGKVPSALVSQLKNQGILVAPIGTRHNQALIAYKKTKNRLEIKNKIQGFIFVPLTGIKR